MNPVPIIIAGGGALLLLKAASLKGAPPAGGPSNQIPLNPAGGTDGGLHDPIGGATETGGSNGEPPAGAGTCLGPACDPGDAGIAPEPRPQAPPSSEAPAPKSPGGGTTSPPIRPTLPGQTAPTTTGASTGAYATTTSREAYVEHKKGFGKGYNGVA